MTCASKALSIDANAVRRYERWRQQWRIGGHNQAIFLLCHHGMARALALSANPPAAPLSEQCSSDAPPLPDCTAVTQAAARMIQQLLVHETGASQHA